jgi:hypothetical protein
MEALGNLAWIAVAFGAWVAVDAGIIAFLHLGKAQWDTDA